MKEGLYDLFHILFKSRFVEAFHFSRPLQAFQETRQNVLAVFYVVHPDGFIEIQILG